MATCPPKRCAASCSSTSCPRSAAVRANSSPAGPPPTTKMRFGCATRSSGSKLSLSSLAAVWLTTQLIRPLVINWPTQPMLEPMQGRMRASSRRRALLTRLGSAMSARTMDTICAAPLATMCWAWSRVMIRPVTMTGLFNPGATT